MYIDGKVHCSTVNNAKNTAEYVVARLVDLGITDCFAVPGDYALSLDHALVGNPKLRYIGCSNELNASYAADGYARERGASILSTTFGVGELSAINGVMGAKAENIVIFHLVGSPASPTKIARKQMHHSLGDGVFDKFSAISAEAACVTAVITPDNAVIEMDRVIHEAFKKRQPAYISIAYDHGLMPVTQKIVYNGYVANYVSQQSQLESAIKFILEKISLAKNIIILPSLKLARFGLVDKAKEVIEKLGCPFVIMLHDKCVICQTHPQYLGYFCGALSDPGIEDKLRDADLILDLGQVYWSDFNSGAFSSDLDLQKFLTLAPNYVRYNDIIFNEVFLGELFDNLIDKLPKISEYANTKITPKTIIGEPSEKIKLESFYSRILEFIQTNDILVVETGSTSLHFPSLVLPEKVKYHNQTLWGSIGWATPATFGVCIASPDKRVILITGEGSHQFTANEIGTMGKYGVKPIIICINNAGYTVERAIEVNPDWIYDDIAEWKYFKLPEVFGCESWISFIVKTNLELDNALLEAKNANVGVYIELITDKYDYNMTMNFYHNKIMSMYGL